MSTQHAQRKIRKRAGILTMKPRGKSTILNDNLKRERQQEQREH
jgi:hypothetical protein